MIRPLRVWTLWKIPYSTETVNGRIVPKDATFVDVSLRVHNSRVIVESVLTLVSMGVVQLFSWFS